MSVPQAPIVMARDLARTFEVVPDEIMTVRVESTQVGGAYTLCDSTVAPGSATPLHVHSTVDEVFMVLDGILDVVCSDQWTRIGPGSTVFVPRGSPHGWTNASDGPTRFLAVFSPGGLEHLFAQLNRTPPHQWAELAAAYDTLIVGPPVNQLKAGAAQVAIPHYGSSSMSQ